MKALAVALTVLAVLCGLATAGAMLLAGWAATYEWERDYGPLLWAVGGVSLLGALLAGGTAMAAWDELVIVERRREHP